MNVPMNRSDARPEGVCGTGILPVFHGRDAHVTAGRAPSSGSALILALWVLLILALIISSFAFDMQVESGVTAYARRRFKAKSLAEGGVEWARYLLARSRSVSEEEEAEEENEGLVAAALNLKRGAGVQSLTLPAGSNDVVRLTMLSEQSRRNVNRLLDEEWEEVLDLGGVPQDLWPELIDAFRDWTDENDEHRINGAESDDPYYVERDYECKNAPLDTVDELLLIKGFTEAILYGGPPLAEDGPPLPGIAQWLTTWDDGRVNVNTASRAVLLSLGLDEFTVDDILLKRLGEDGLLGTRDDGLTQGGLTALGLDQDRTLTTDASRFLRVVSIGESGGVRSGIWCVLYLDDRGQAQTVFWREETMR